MGDLKQRFPYGKESIIPNEIRRKYGLGPIPGGDVELISISDSSQREGDKEMGRRKRWPILIFSSNDRGEVTKIKWINHLIQKHYEKIYLKNGCSRCTYCMNLIPETAKYCPYCGRPTKTKIS